RRPHGGIGAELAPQVIQILGAEQVPATEHVSAEPLRRLPGQGSDQLPGENLAGLIVRPPRPPRAGASARRPRRSGSRSTTTSSPLSGTCCWSRTALAMICANRSLPLISAVLAGSVPVALTPGSIWPIVDSSTLVSPSDGRTCPM